MKSDTNREEENNDKHKNKTSKETDEEAIDPKEELDFTKSISSENIENSEVKAEETHIIEKPEIITYHPQSQTDNNYVFTKDWTESTEDIDLEEDLYSQEIKGQKGQEKGIEFEF